MQYVVKTSLILNAAVKQFQTGYLNITKRNFYVHIIHTLHCQPRNMAIRVQVIQFQMSTYARASP